MHFNTATVLLTRYRRTAAPGLFALSLLNIQGALAQKSQISEEETRLTLQRAVAFFRENAGYQGAYVYRCSADLTYREGEGRASSTTGWTEPPGTPFVGEVYLQAYRITGEKFLLEAAMEVAEALRRSQLESGGWAGSFELGKGREKYRYRIDPPRTKARNHTTLDDEKTQACLMFLIRLDEATGLKNKKIRDVLDYAFSRVLDAQFRNGAWPQQFSGPAPREGGEVKKANYPENWPRTFPGNDYRQYYTLNDGTIADMMHVMLEAHRVYREERFALSARRTGDFFLLAQMPDPQPGWAQQYNPNMEPAWARKFEPPAITGGESQGVMRALLTIYEATGDKKYLEPLPRAIAYYRKSLRDDGKLARFYELHTNKPLYFTKDYRLTYSDADPPTHYAFVIRSKLDSIESRYKALAKMTAEQLKVEAERPVRRLSPNASLREKARQAVDALDKRGAWVTKGRLRNYGKSNDQVIETTVFAERLEALAQCLAAFRN